MQPEVVEEISAAAAIDLQASTLSPVSGGDISAAYQVLDESDRPYFLKTNTANFLDAFTAEQEGLFEIAGSESIRVPQPIASGVTGSTAWLLMEWLEFARGTSSDAELGRALARMHSVTKDSFGWHRDNYIGATPQLNERSDDWVSFYKEQRLRPQLEWASERGASADVIEQGLELLDHVHAFFTAYQPAPALLHGDLWGGNRGTLADGRPVIFDPAVYFGDPETDLAMTQLFGGFGADFYTSYDSVVPRAPGADLRRTLYQLYHVLNHYNLFGGAYLAQADRMLRDLLAAR